MYLKCKSSNDRYIGFNSFEINFEILIKIRTKKLCIICTTTFKEYFGHLLKVHSNINADRDAFKVKSK